MPNPKPRFVLFIFADQICRKAICPAPTADGDALHTPRPIPLWYPEGHKAEQDRQESSNGRPVNGMLHLSPSTPKELRVDGKGQPYTLPTCCSPSPARSVNLREFHEINLISSFMVFPWSGFYKAFPSSEGRPRGSIFSSAPCRAALQEDLPLLLVAVRNAWDSSRPYTLKVAFMAQGRTWSAVSILLGSS